MREPTKDLEMKEVFVSNEFKGKRERRKRRLLTKNRKIERKARKKQEK